MAMQEAYSLATESARKRAGRGKKHYDKRVRSSVLKAGDRVLVRNLTPRGGPGKLRSFWEKDVHIVVKRHGDSSPVYDVKPEIGTGAIRTLHRNHLLVCDFLQPDTWEDLPQITRNRPYAQHTRNTTASSSDDDDDDVESDDDLPHSVPDDGVRQNTGDPRYGLPPRLSEPSLPVCTCSFTEIPAYVGQLHNWKRFCGTSLWHPTSITCLDGTTNCSFSH